MEVSVVTPQAPNAPSQPERGVDQLRQSLKIGIRQKASSAHLMVNNRITKDGKTMAAAIYQEESQFGANTGQFIEASKAIRQDIREELTTYRKEAKAAVLASLQTEGKTRRQIGKDEFKQLVKNKLILDFRVQEAQAMRKLLSSIVQRAKNADVRKIRLKLKAEVTEEEINVRLQQLQVLRAEGKIKRVPGRELVRNAIAEQKRKALRELLQAQEMLQMSPIPAPEQVVTQAAEVPPKVNQAEQQDARTAALISRVRSRIDLQRSSLGVRVVQAALLRGQLVMQGAKDTVTGIGKSVVRRPLAFAAAGFAIAGVLGLQNPQTVGATMQDIARAVSTPGPFSK